MNDPLILARHMLENDARFDQWQNDKKIKGKKVPSDDEILDVLMVDSDVYSFLVSKSKILFYFAEKVLTEKLGETNHTRDSNYEVLKGIGYYNREDYPAAKDYLSPVAPPENPNWVAYYYAGLIYIKEKRNDKALKFFRSIIKKFSSREVEEEFKLFVVETSFRMAEIFEQEGNIKEAEECYTRVKQNIPESDSKQLAFVLRKRCLLRMQLESADTISTKRDIKKVIELMEKAYVKDNFAFALMYVCAGILLFSEKREKEALAFFKKALTYRNDILNSEINYEPYLKIIYNRKEVAVKIVELKIKLSENEADKKESALKKPLQQNGDIGKEPEQVSSQNEKKRKLSQSEDEKKHSASKEPPMKKSKEDSLVSLDLPSVKLNPHSFHSQKKTSLQEKSAQESQPKSQEKSSEPKIWMYDPGSQGGAQPF